MYNINRLFYSSVKSRATRSTHFDLVEFVNVGSTCKSLKGKCIYVIDNRKLSYKELINMKTKYQKLFPVVAYF